MSDPQDLSRIIFAFMRQTAIDVPQSGAGAFGLDLLPSQGLASQAQSIASGLMTRNKMKKRPRRGSEATTATYETELIKGCFEEIGLGVLGADAWTAAVTKSESDLTSVVVSGTGTVLTFGGGDLIALGFRAGQFVRFSALATSGNDGKWVPVLDVGGASNRVMHVPSGYLVDESIDSAFSLTIARYIVTPTFYQQNSYSCEEQWRDIDQSKFAQNIKFNSLVFSESPTAYSKFALGVAGRKLERKDTPDSPVFTDPITIPVGESLILLDGGLFLTGEKRIDITSLTFGMTAPVTTTAVIGSLDGPSAKLGDFDFAGNVTGVVADGDDFGAYETDEDVSLLLHYKDKQDQSGIGVYAGNLGYASYGSPVAGAGDLTQTLAIYGGNDDRGAGYAPTTLMLSDLVV